MKLGYKLYFYLGSYFELLSRSTGIFQIQNESCQQNLEKTKNNGEHEKRDNITLECLEFIC